MLTSVSIRNFRNLNISELDLRPGITVLVGENGQGKTNILEAIYFLAYGKSFRDIKDRVIAWHSEEAGIFAKTEAGTIGILIRRGKENKVSINGKSKSVFALLGRFVAVAFHPQDLELVFGAPVIRRAWLDRLIATADKNYLYGLVTYQRTLQNKNKLLKTRAVSGSELEVWNKSLAAHGSKIWRTREETVSNLNQILKGRSLKTAGKRLYIEYKNPIFNQAGADAEKLYLQKLASQESLERKFLVTLFGPHRDDFKIIAEETDGANILQKDLAIFGSRAEQRQAALLLKLAEATLLTKFFARSPTLLLDDVASELDAKNRRLLFDSLAAQQIILTTTNLDDLPQVFREKGQILTVREGKVAPH